MQQHLKERLTGAAIIVFVVVLLVPEMFRGRPAVGSDSHAGPADGAPMRSVTIDLRDAPTTQPPASLATSAQAGDNPTKDAPGAVLALPPATQGERAGSAQCAVAGCGRRESPARTCPHCENNGREGATCKSATR